MPAVDILLTSPAANPERAETSPGNSGRSSAGDDFASAMKKALAPKERSPSDKPVARATPTSNSRNTANQTKASGTNAPDTATLTGANETSDVVAEVPRSGVQKEPADSEKSAAALPDGLFPIIDVAPPTPIFLNVAASVSFTPQPVIANGTAPTNNAAPAVASDLPAPQPATFAGVAAAPVSALPVSNAPVMSTLAPEISPAQTNALRAEPALTKTLAVDTEPRKISGAAPLVATPAAAKETTPGNVVLPATLFAPVAEAAAAPEMLALPAEVSAEALKEAAATANAEAPAVNAGTGVATSGSAMKKADKTNKIAGLDVQILPGAGQESPRESVLMPRVAVAAVRTIENHPSDFTPAFAGSETGLPLPSAATVAAAFNTIELPSLADARLKSVERTHDMVALHAMRLVESKSDVLSVVIKPAVGTELTLELRQRDGGVEAQAMLSRGDYQFLNQHWPELQQRLEQRGIKLAPLGGETNFSQNDNQQQQRSARDEAAMESAAAFAEFASVGGATARRALSLNGWESWA